MRNAKFFVGAPDSESLEFNGSDAVDDFVPAIRRFLSGQYTENGPNGSVSDQPSQFMLPKWRSIGIGKFTEVVNDETAYEIADSEEPRLQELGNGSIEFLEHSLAVFEGQETIETPNDFVIDADTPIEDTAFDSVLTGDPENLLQDDTITTDVLSQLPAADIIPSPITDLSQLPSVTHINSIHPQTVTVTLLVGVISVSPLRQIQLKRYSRHMEILEIMVGDETHAAFTVSVWLDPKTAERSDESLRATVMALRPRDIICLQNVALSVFRSRVYGQSLSRRISRVETKVQILGKGGQVAWDRLKNSDSSRQLEKVKRVENWAHAFLCYPKKRLNLSGKPSTHRRQENLPPDTQ